MLSSLFKKDDHFCAKCDECFKRFKSVAMAGDKNPEYDSVTDYKIEPEGKIYELVHEFSMKGDAHFWIVNNDIIYTPGTLPSTHIANIKKAVEELEFKALSSYDPDSSF